MTKSFISTQVVFLSLTSLALAAIDESPQPDQVTRMGMDDSGNEMGMGMKMMMPMYFWTGNSLTWLINGWDSTTGGSYFLGLLVSFCLGVSIEALTFFRNYMYIMSQTAAIERTVELNRYVSPEKAM